MPPDAIAFLGAITLVGAFVLLFPVVRALAERIRGRGNAGTGEELAAWRDDLAHDVQQMRREVDELRELGERVDFLERLVAKQRDPERLPPVR